MAGRAPPGEVPATLLRSWQGASSAAGVLRPRIPQPRRFGELEAFQRSAPRVLAAMARCRHCPSLPRRALTAGSARPCLAGALVLPDTHVSPSPRRIQLWSLLAEVLIPTGPWVASWQPNVPLLPAFVISLRRCSCSSPCLRYLSPTRQRAREDAAF